MQLIAIFKVAPEGSTLNRRRSRKASTEADVGSMPELVRRSQTDDQCIINGIPSSHFRKAKANESEGKLMNRDRLFVCNISAI